MKLVYDISVLGTGHYHSRARTGVFRVVENIAYGLVSSEECNLNFSAMLSLENVEQTIAYLQSNKDFSSAKLIFPQLQKNVYKSIKSKIENINDQAEIGLQSKTLRRALYCVLRTIENSYKTFDIKQLHDRELFHSPFHPLPKNVDSKKHKKVLTIYDLIPILYPQYFEFDEDHLINEVIKSLTPDDWAICISEATKEDLCNYRKDIDPAKVFVTHLAASDLFYPCDNSEQINMIKGRYSIPDAPYILSLSTLEPRKNIAHTIRCFAMLAEQENIEDLHLVLVGTKGWSYHSIFQEISNFSALKDRIIVTGYVADEDLAALYSGAIAFVYPSFYEGFGLPPLEAMQCGVPVITSNTSSLPEVVGNAGIMVSPQDSDALCQSILDIYSNSSLRESMSLKSLEQARRFSWEKCTQETIQVYKTALSS